MTDALRALFVFVTLVALLLGWTGESEENIWESNDR
jgi:hypothetical protein